MYPLGEIRFVFFDVPGGSESEPPVRLKLLNAFSQHRFVLRSELRQNWTWMKLLHTTYERYPHKTLRNPLRTAIWRTGGGGGRYPFHLSVAFCLPLGPADRGLDKLTGQRGDQLAFLYSSRPRSNMIALLSCRFSTRLA